MHVFALCAGSAGACSVTQRSHRASGTWQPTERAAPRLGTGAGERLRLGIEDELVIGPRNKKLWSFRADRPCPGHSFAVELVLGLDLAP